MTEEVPMALARWTPVNELTGLHNTMDRLFSDLFEGMESSGSQPATFRLPVDIKETKDGYEIKAPIAGFKPEDVEVTFADGVLGIKATHKEEKSKQEGNYIRREVFFGNFQRQILLPPDVQGDNIKASFDHGLLTIEVPRSQAKEGSRENGKEQLVASGTQKS